VPGGIDPSYPTGDAGLRDWRLCASTSCDCQLALLRSRCGVFERGEDVLAFQAGVVGQHVIDAGAGGELAEHRADGDAGLADAGQPSASGWGRR